jgi:hypothetical protein
MATMEQGFDIVTNTGTLRIITDPSVSEGTLEFRCPTRRELEVKDDLDLALDFVRRNDVEISVFTQGRVFVCTMTKVFQGESYHSRGVGICQRDAIVHAHLSFLRADTHRGVVDL